MNESTYSNQRRELFPTLYTENGASVEDPGRSYFLRVDDRVFHTYSCYSRGLDMLNAAYHYLDLVPRGRDEKGLPWPMAWVHRRDSYPDK